MTIVTLLADSLPVETVATVPNGYSQIANPFRTNTGTPKYFSGTNSNNCIWIYNTALTGAVFYSRIILDSVISDASGVVVCNASGVGYELLINSTLGARLFAMTSGGVLGAQKGSTVAVSASAGQVVEIEVRTNDPSPGNIRLICKVNGVTLINFTEANANTTWYGGGVCRNTGRLRALEVEYTAPFSISTSTSPLVPNASSSWTSVGFSAGAAVLSFAGVSIPVVIANNAFTAFIPMIVDNVEWPKLPATSQTITLTQGANSATAAANIAPPTGYEVTRDGGGSPADFLNVVVDDSTYLGYWFATAGNPLTANDRMYWPTAGGLHFERDGEPVLPADSAPLTTEIIIHRGDDGRTYVHEVTVTEYGIVDVDTGVIEADIISHIAISSLAITSIALQ